MSRITKEFDDYPACTRWLTERGLSGIIGSVLPDGSSPVEEMFPGGVLLTLEGEAAQRVLDIERPIDPAGFRLVEVA